MTELEKQVNAYYINRYKEEVDKRRNAEQKAVTYHKLYEDKCKEVERAELIIELLLNRLEKTA